MILLLRHTFRALARLRMLLGFMLRAARFKHGLKQRFDRNKESAESMKKSYLIAVIAALAAVAGALTAVAIYLHRREKELDEYEQLLFGEDEAAEGEEAAAGEESAAGGEAAAEPAAAAAEEPVEASKPAAE